MSGLSVGINQTARFAHASSFKFSIAALLLQRHAAGTIDADRKVTWREADMLEPSPFTSERLASGATLRELARARELGCGMTRIRHLTVTDPHLALLTLLAMLGGRRRVWMPVQMILIMVWMVMLLTMICRPMERSVSIHFISV